MLAISPATDAVLVAGLVLATSIWVGGIVTIVIVARVARRTLAPADSVAFFRALGVAFGPVGAVALLVALALGAALAFRRPWDASLTATVLVAVVLLVVTAWGIVQARSMTRLRTRALQHPDDTALARGVKAGATRAMALRAAITALTLVLLGLGAALAAAG